MLVLIAIKCYPYGEILTQSCDKNTIRKANRHSPSIRLDKLE